MSRLSIVLAVVSCVELCAEPPAFDIEVEAVFSKAGCNAGTCHGNQNGKGGFKLSLRGQDPHFDYLAVTSLNGGRRVNLLEPEKSLLLRKPTAQLAHQGGRRLSPGGKLYDQVIAWIRAGVPAPTSDVSVTSLIVSPEEAIRFSPTQEVQLSVKANFSDGTRRDITDVAVYEASNLKVSVTDSGTVMRNESGETTVIVRYLDQSIPVRIAFLDAVPNYQWNARPPRNYVDDFVFAKLRKYRSNPALRCTDRVFLRRVYLDLLGILPTADEARSFLDCDKPAKRERLVDTLLSRPEFADHWALKWADLLRVEEKVLDRRGVEVFHGWIRDNIAAGRPLNQFVADMLTARGSTYENPPTNYFRALREINARGEAAARVFLGTRLQCAQCHNHPFDRWTQDDYYAWSALFSRIDYEIPDLKRLDKLDKNQFVGEQFVRVKADVEVTNPTTGEVMQPRFLGDDWGPQDGADRLEKLVKWMTLDSRQFAKAQVNRIWFHLMGRGLVNPVDDFRITNPASHPELLERLTSDFIEHGFDLRHLISRIANSESYQLATQPVPASGDFYAHVAARRLSAEQLLDSQANALQATLQFNGHPIGIRAAQLPGVHKVRAREKAPSPADRFLFAFGKPERLMTCECERSDSTTLSQALLLVNGDCIDHLLTQQSNLIGQLLAQDATLDDAIQELYWSALSRPPTSEERNNSHSVIAHSPSQRQGLEDVAWALLNAKEFVFRQ